MFDLFRDGCLGFNWKFIVNLALMDLKELWNLLISPPVKKLVTIVNFSDVVNLFKTADLLALHGCSTESPSGVSTNF